MNVLEKINSICETRVSCKIYERNRRGRDNKFLYHDFDRNLKLAAAFTRECIMHR